MPFGKRPPETRTSSWQAAEPAPEGSLQERLEGLRDALMGLLLSAGRIADAIRSDDTVSVLVDGHDPDPESGPLALTGFANNFIYFDDGRLRHSLLAYGDPARPGQADPNAQFHLHELTGHVLELNLFCQHAKLDDALGVALQSPHVPALIDSILVPAAFFAALTDNILARDGGAPDLAADKANLERHLLMAADKMLDPKRMEALLPVKHWPFIGLVVPVAPHDGDYFLNGVYFPADHASVLLARAGFASGGLRIPTAAVA
jgi:hypothetical protein